MADGKLSSQWQQTATILSALCNPHRDTKRHPRPFTPDDFNPYARREKPKPKQHPILAMAEMMGLDVPESALKKHAKQPSN